MTQEDEHFNKHLSYLATTYNIMELLSSDKPATHWAPAYFSCLAVGHPTFQVRPDNEIASTIEIIMSRYAYAFGRLHHARDVHLSIEHFCVPGKFEQLSGAVKKVLEVVEDVCVRFAKFFYARDIIWSSIEAVAEKYEGFPELNYHLLEAYYM